MGYKPFAVEHAWPVGFGLFPDHCQDVLKGCYDVPLEFPEDKPPSVLDLGANVGAFAIWAANRWPGAKIDCYEPHPKTFELLKRTGQGWRNWTLHEVAVSEKSGTGRLFDGPLNIGESSLVIQHKTIARPIKVIASTELPKADVLKMDTEGAEPLILKGLYEAGRLHEFKAILLETHGPNDQKYVQDLLRQAGFTVTHRNQWHPNRAELCYVRTDLIPAGWVPEGPQRVLVATPLRGGLADAYAFAWLKILTANWDGRFEMIPIFQKAGDISTARDFIANYALNNDIDIIFWWDKDLHNQDDELTLAMASRILSHDEDFVSAIYRGHGVVSHFHGCRLEGAVPDSRGLLEMSQMPLGFSKLRVSALRKIMEMFPERIYFHQATGREKETGIYNFFPQGIIGPNTPEGKIERINDIVYEMAQTDSVHPLDEIRKVLCDSDYSETRKLGEDYYFCRICREAGIRLWQDTGFIIPHEETMRVPIPTPELTEMMAEEWRQPKNLKPELVKKPSLLKRLAKAAGG